MTHWEISSSEDGPRLEVRPVFPEAAESWSMKGNRLRIQFESGRFVLFTIDNTDRDKLIGSDELLVLEFPPGSTEPARELIVIRE